MTLNEFRRPILSNSITPNYNFYDREGFSIHQDTSLYEDCLLIYRRRCSSVYSLFLECHDSTKLFTFLFLKSQSSNKARTLLLVMNKNYIKSLNSLLCMSTIYINSKLRYCFAFGHISNCFIQAESFAPILKARLWEPCLLQQPSGIV